MRLSLPPSSDDSTDQPVVIHEEVQVNYHPPSTESPMATSLREDILDHFRSLQLPALNGGGAVELSKETIRASHAYQRSEVTKKEWKVLRRYSEELLQQFANGSELKPALIQPELVPVDSDQSTGNLFRFAALLWSVPVSHGYGRRLRFLVRDQQNGKLIGILALGDPVFNLQCRDKWIGWDVNDRRARLVHVMDAYVVGAVPPYNQLLGGKLVASLIGSAEVSQAFSERYGQTTGIISQQQKAARLALVTITSALGRSSLYNRLRLNDPKGVPLVNLERIGETRGYGHFQLSNDLFERIRQLLIDENHPYANGHQFGEGPNWRFRVIRVGLKRLGLDEELIRHGIHREVYAMPMASSFKDFLCGRVGELDLHRPSVASISTVALQRWMIPRAIRNPGYHGFQREQILEMIGVIANGEELTPVNKSQTRFATQLQFDNIPLLHKEEIINASSTDG
jgi:hypothetical protein